MQPTTHTAEQRQPLRRANDGRMIAGVCAGLADYLDVDPVIVRVGVAVLTLMAGIGLPLYLAAWLLVPEEHTDESIAEHVLRDARSGSGWPPHVHVHSHQGHEDESHVGDQGRDDAKAS